MTNIDMIAVGKRIRELRLELGMQQKELAGKIGVARNTLTQYESGYSKMCIDVLARLAIELDTTTDYILGLSDY